MTVQATMVIMKKVQVLLLEEEENKEGGTEALHMIEEGDEVEHIMTVMNLKMMMMVANYKILLVADFIEEATKKRDLVN